MLNAPPIGLTTYFHTKMVAAPTIRPAIAPCLLERFQNSAQRTIGPKVAPKPAHAKDTISKTELSGLDAMNTAITEIATTATLATIIVVLSLSLIPRKSFKTFCATDDDAARSCESAVDIVAARIPARISPAITAATGPMPLISLAITTITVSEDEPSRNSKAPALVIPYPITPIKIAIASDTTTQTVAIRLESVSFSFSSIAIKRSSTCGIPKYPSPHASVETIEMKP